MSKYKITKKRLAEIIKEEYASIQEQKAEQRQDESSCGTHAANRDEKKPDEDGDGVPDWADKKDGDDNADEKNENVEAEEEEQITEEAEEEDEDTVEENSTEELKEAIKKLLTKHLKG